MKKKDITTQIDAMLSVAKSSLNLARKEVFKFYIKTLEPKTNELMTRVKHAFEHTDVEKGLKQKQNTVTQNLPLSRFILWIGIGASITGVLILISPDRFVGWQLFLVPLIAILGPWLLDFFRESSKEAKDTLEGYEGRQLIGNILRLSHPIVNGESTVLLNNVEWILKGDDCPKGGQVRVIAVSKKILYVTRVK